MRIERAASADAVAAVQPPFDHGLRPEADGGVREPVAVMFSWTF